MGCPSNYSSPQCDQRTIVVQDASSFEAESGRLQRAVFAGIKRLTNKLSNLQVQLAAQLQAEHTRHLADLLTANLHLCRQGDASIEVALLPSLCLPISRLVLTSCEVLEGDMRKPS